MIRKAERIDSSAANTVVEVGSVRFGHDPFPVIAGPCVIESEAQIKETAEAVAAAGGAMLRAGTSVAGASPYEFRGLGSEGLKMLRAAGDAVGLPVVTQVIEPAGIPEASELADMIEIGAGNMQNFELLRAIGQQERPVLLKRGPSATIDEWLWAAEYILAEGNDNVVLCERGIRTFADGDTLDISSVPIVKERTHLPVIVLPSHSAGSRARVVPLALAAQGVGADGLAVEVHPTPEAALVNAIGQLAVSEFAHLMEALGINRMRKAIDLVDRDIVRLLSRRRDLALQIGRVKAERGMSVRSPAREAELVAIIREEAVLQDLDPEQAEAVFQVILAGSRAEQRRLRSLGEL
ncbi:MAG: bifunctional 3-deoxy-7-phosphoheptulonate synthase/chorismate mutase [Acidimicrobiia bacterium]|nr:bifunctional 3-deoxy-7-phosphoheptulonate synthase/chorismate mutase [Acidimicrobiia bacterium]